MPQSGPVRFGPFRLDPENAGVWRGTEQIRLAPKAFAVLQILVAHAGRLVTKDALWQAVWPDVAVTESALTVCIREIRRGLGDDAHTPRLIETVHRRGYRFIAPVAPEASLESPPEAPVLPPSVVGRQRELDRLDECLVQVLRGERRAVFITGESGIGKTTLVDTFLAGRAGKEQLWVARGQSIEHLGAGEAYLPVLDALAHLCREPGARPIVDLLARYAPSWLAQMPAVLGPADSAVAGQGHPDPTRDRMLREIADAVEAITRQRPLVLVLEDLHWSDRATLDLIAWLARGRALARFLLLGTYRPADAIAHAHPLRGVTRELSRHPQCQELPLELLGEVDVARYLSARFSGCVPAERLAVEIHRRTDGNPLFIVAVCDALVSGGWLAEIDGRWDARAGADTAAMAIPPSLRQLVEQQWESLGPEDQQLLESASVAGMEFSAASVAAGMEADLELVEERCAALQRRGQFLRVSGQEEWPDGTAARRYRFLHTVYQHVTYDRLFPVRRAQLHRRIGTRIEVAYREHLGERAGELARHFVEGRDEPRAARYLRLAAENALRRSGYHEAIGHLRQGLDLLLARPEGLARDREELEMRIMLGPALMATRGFAALDAGEGYARARELCERVGDRHHLLPTLWGLRTHHSVRGQPRVARELALELLSRAREEEHGPYTPLAHLGLGMTLHYLGDLADAREQLELGLALSPGEGWHPHGLPPEQQNVRLAGLRYLACVLWALGHPDQALDRATAALDLARKSSDVVSVIASNIFLARVHQFRGDPERVREVAEVARALAREHGFAQRLAAATILWGWALAARGQTAEGIAAIIEGIAAFRATGAVDDVPYWLALLAEARGIEGRVDDALRDIDEALELVEAGGLRVWEAELHRLRGELLRRPQSDSPAGASRVELVERCFLEALAVARSQQAKALELRAATSLARLRLGQDDRGDARRILSDVYGWFSEGFDTPDLTEARRLLTELG